MIHSLATSLTISLTAMLLGGLMLPYSMLPEIAGKFAQLLPATQAMNAFNGLAMGKSADFAPWGSVIAAPAFQEIAERLVVMMGLPPDTSVAQQTVGG